MCKAEYDEMTTPSDTSMPWTIKYALRVMQNHQIGVRGGLGQPWSPGEVRRVVQAPLYPTNVPSASCTKMYTICCAAGAA